MKGKMKLWYYNIRLCLSYNIVIFALFMISSALFFDFRDMEQMQYIRMGEVYLPLSGMFLFVPIGGLEEHAGSWELVCPKRRKYVFIQLFRILFLTLLQIVMFLILLSFIWLESPYIQPWDSFLGIYVDSFFVGILGMFFADISGNYGIGYIVALGYYGVGTMLGNNGLAGYFQLTGYLNHQVISKYVLLALALLIILLDSIYYCLKQRTIKRRRK